MLPETVSILLDLNRQFYQQFGRAFAATRQRLQPGVIRLLGQLPLEGRWLDLGCGNGELAKELGRRGFRGEYVGLDFSKELINIAVSARKAGRNSNINFSEADLSNSTWSDSFPPAYFDTVLSFAALHHLPGAGLRRAVLAQVRRLLPSGGGTFIHSEWQFQHSPRLLARVQPWEKIGLGPALVEEGDYLMDWRYALPGQPAESTGLRYVHLFSLGELFGLAGDCGFQIEETFESDGQGGRLGLYQIWKTV